MSVSAYDIRRAIQTLGLADQVLCVHSSLRSFGHVEGGAPAILEGLLSAGCTVLVPAFTYDFGVPPPPDQSMRPSRNGYYYDLPYERGNTRIYTPASKEISKDMGALPAAVLAHPQHARGYHPINSFAAVGPLAHGLVSGQTPLSVYAPFHELIAHHGTVIMMGVGLDTMTLIHYAEQRAGRTLFRRWANGPDGVPMQVEVGSCSDGFGHFDPIFASFERRYQVGQSLWRVFPAADVLDTATESIQQDTQITHCADVTCTRCNDAVLGGPILVS